MTPSLPVVFIGPMAAGKSTLASKLAEQLGVRQVPFDAVRFYYYLLDGFSFAEQLAKPDFRAVTEYWKPFEIGAVERILVEFGDSVIDFGAGHAHMEHPAHLARLEAALAPLPNVFLLLPSLDLDRAEQISIERDRERLGDRWDATRAEMAREFVHSASFRRVAKHTVVTGDRAVEDALDEVMALLR